MDIFLRDLDTVSHESGNVADLVEGFQRKYVDEIPLHYFRNRFFEYPDSITESDKFEFFKFCSDLQNDCNWHMIYASDFSSIRIKSQAKYGDADFFILEETLFEGPFDTEETLYWYGIFYSPADSHLEFSFRKGDPDKIVPDSPFAGNTVHALALHLSGRRYR